MKFVVMSDIHSNLFAFNLVLQDAQKEKVEDFIFLGDYITDGEDANTVLDIVKSKASYAILGNREKYIINYSPEKRSFNNYKTIANTYNSLSKENIAYINSLEKWVTIKINNFKVLLIHGDEYFSLKDGLHAMFDKIIEEYDFDICLFGHIHEYVYTNYKGKTFINPGAVSQSVDTPSYKYCIIDIQDKIDVKLKEIPVSDTYEKLEKEYKKTDYYKENRVWSNLILKTIKDAKDYSIEFLDLFNEKIKECENIDVKKFNKIWDETYDTYYND